jgi:hypothetical protein
MSRNALRQLEKRKAAQKIDKVCLPQNPFASVLFAVKFQKSLAMDALHAWPGSKEKGDSPPAPRVARLVLWHR